MKSNINILFFFLISIGIFGGCGKSVKKKLETKSTQLAFVISDSISSFPENNLPIGKIESASFIDIDRFVFCTSEPANVYIYKTNGQKELEFNNIGRGPNEFLSPTIVKCFNGLIYVWCSQQMKISIFDFNGQPISELLNLNRIGVSDFLVYNDFICFYHVGGWEKIISIYDMKKSEYVLVDGVASNEHQVLSLRPKAGGMAIKNGTLYYVFADKLELYSIDLSNYSTDVIHIINTDFQVKELDTNSNDLINGQMQKALDYLFTNSIVTDLNIVNDTIIIITETGKFETSLVDKSLDFSNRYYQYYFISPDNKINSFRRKIESRLDLEYPPVYASFDEAFFSINGKMNNESFYYQLNRLNIKPN